MPFVLLSDRFVVNCKLIDQPSVRERGYRYVLNTVAVMSTLLESTAAAVDLSDVNIAAGVAMEERRKSRGARACGPARKTPAAAVLVMAVAAAPIHVRTTWA
jgi:hypothetical protein